MKGVKEMDTRGQTKITVSGKAFDLTKAKVAVPITARNMARCQYHRGTLYRAAKGTWVRVMEPDDGEGYAVEVPDDEAKKHLIAAGRIDLVEKYFGKLEKA